MNTSITDLYIIGNGFDLHHGINSSYFEYRIWLKKHYEDIYWEIVNTFEVDDESEDYKIKLEEKNSGATEMIFFFSKNIKVSGLFVRMLHVISPNYHKMPAWTGIVHLLPHLIILVH